MREAALGVLIGGLLIASLLLGWIGWQQFGLLLVVPGACG